jgi:hypothetical protein
VRHWEVQICDDGLAKYSPLPFGYLSDTYQYLYPYKHIKLFRQPSDWTCGPAALTLFFYLTGRTLEQRLRKGTTQAENWISNLKYYTERHPYNVISDLTRRLGTQEEAGTDPTSIRRFLRTLFPRLKNPFTLVKTPADLLAKAKRGPVLVNYFDGGDGHYGVIIGVREVRWTKHWPSDPPYKHKRFSHVRLFNPDGACIEEKDFDDFVENWYSPRYGKQWGIAVR